MSSDRNLWHKRLVHEIFKTIKSLCEKSSDVPQLKGNLAPWHPFHMSNAKRKSFGSMFEPSSHAASSFILTSVASYLPAFTGASTSVLLLNVILGLLISWASGRKETMQTCLENTKNWNALINTLTKVWNVCTVTGESTERFQLTCTLISHPTIHSTDLFVEPINQTLTEPDRFMLEESGLSGNY